VNEPERIRAALESAETVAVVGCSPDRGRPSHAIARYLQEQGYRVVPVNPWHGQLLGERCYASLAEIPEAVRIDIVDVFRRSDALPALAEEAIARGVPFFFMQQGVIDEAVARRLESRGVEVAMDRCILVEHQRFGIPAKSRNAKSRPRVP
jgi:predicted CoA-binding protein